MKQFAAPLDAEPLLDAEMVPTQPAVQKGVAEQVDIMGLADRVNRVLVGSPQTIDILQNWPAEERIQDEIEGLRGEWDFFSVRLACSFVPDRRCRFTWVRLGMTLESEPAPESGVSDVVAFDLFPRNVGTTRTYHRSFKITPSLKFAFGELSASGGVEQDVVSYEPEIDSSGLLTDTPTWTFTAPARPGLTGSKELFLILKAPKGGAVAAKFAIGAEVASDLGPLSLRRRDEDAEVARRFTLVPKV
jgi:hypothetical protein